MKTFAFEMCENAFVIFFLSIRLESIQVANGNLLPMSKNEFAEKKSIDGNRNRNPRRSLAELPYLHQCNWLQDLNSSLKDFSYLELKLQTRTKTKQCFSIASEG